MAIIGRAHTMHTAASTTPMRAVTVMQVPTHL